MPESRHRYLYERLGDHDFPWVGQQLHRRLAEQRGEGHLHRVRGDGIAEADVDLHADSRGADARGQEHADGFVELVLANPAGRDAIRIEAHPI